MKEKLHVLSRILLGKLALLTGPFYQNYFWVQDLARKESQRAYICLNHLLCERTIQINYQWLSTHVSKMKEKLHIPTDMKTMYVALEKLRWYYKHEKKKGTGISVNRSVIYLHPKVTTGWDENEKMRSPFGQAITWDD